MTVYDLNRDQLTELKQRYYADVTGRDLSYGELADIDSYVSDEAVYDEYAGVQFTNDDFFCSAIEEDDYESNIRFFIADSGRNQTFYLYAVNGVEYQWSDWATSTFSKRGAQDALRWAKNNGYRNAKAIAIID